MLNKVQLIGRLGREFEVKKFENGGQIGKIRMATSKTWKDKISNEWKEKTDWHSVIVRVDKLVESLAKKLKVGDLVYVEGELQYRKYESNGVEKVEAEINVGLDGTIRQLSLNNAQSSNENQDSSKPRKTNAEMKAAMLKKLNDLEEDNDKIPF